MAEIRRLSVAWNEGAPVKELAERFGRSPGAITRITERYREMFPYRKPRPNLDARRIIAHGADRLRRPIIEGLWNGMTVKEIAAKEGVKYHTVTDRLNSVGLTVRSLLAVPEDERRGLI